MSTTTWESTALVVVDMQNDFVDPAGGLPVAGGPEVLPVVNALVDAAVTAGAPVFYTKDWHPAFTPHFAKDGGIWPVHCVHDTWGAAFHPDLRVAGTVVHKGSEGGDGYSGFTVRDPASALEEPTELVPLVAASGARRLVVAGLAGDYCVKETTLDGLRLGYAVTVPLAATRFVNLAPGDDEAAIRAMTAAGAEVSRAAPA